MRYATLRSRDAFSVGLIHLGAKDLATPNPPDNPNGTRLSPMSSVRSVTYVSGPDKGFIGRGTRIRTADLQYPKLPRYQAALYPGFHRIASRYTLETSAARSELARRIG